MVAPWWLLGLLFVPLIRWLHRGGAQRRALPVAFLGLWSSPPASSPAPQPRMPPDPAWRRRAALVALLCVALAGPRWPVGSTVQVLWVDDGPSLLMREDGGTRLALGLAAARAALTEAGGTIQVRTLSDPWRDLATARGLDDAVQARLAEAISARAQGHRLDDAASRPVKAPPAALLERDPSARHWLLSDGVRGDAVSWPGGRTPEKVFGAGRKDRNVGLVLLSARHRGAAGSATLDLLVGVRNGGASVESRELRLLGPAGTTQRQSLTLSPGQTRWLALAAPLQTNVRAQIVPADDLALDDVLSLDTRALLPAVVAVDPRCPGALAAAILVHPGLTPPADDRVAEARVVCGPDDSARAGVPTLHLPLNGPPRRVPGPWQTAPDWSDLNLPRGESGALPVRGRLALRPGDQVMLAAGAEALLAMRADPRQLYTSLDLASWSPDLAAALWLNRMLEWLLGRALLDAVVHVGRTDEAVQVQSQPPTALETPRDARPPLPMSVPASFPTQLALVLAAAALLALELGRTWQRRRWLQGPWAASSVAAAKDHA